MVMRCIKSASIFLTLLALVVFVGLHTTVWAAEGAGEAASASLGEIWAARAGDLDAIAQEAAELQGNAEKLAGPLANNLRQARVRFTRLSGLFQASRGHPTEQLTLVQQMHVLHAEAVAAVSPLEAIAAAMNNRLEELNLQQKDLNTLSRESAAEGVSLRASGGADAGQMAAYAKSLEQAKNRLDEASARLAAILGPARASLARMEQSINNMESSLSDIWGAYYLKPSGGDFGAVASIPAQLAAWATSMGSRLAFAYPQSGPEWLESLKHFSLVGVVMALLGIAALRGARFLPLRWHSACASVITHSWVLAGLGAAGLAASVNKYGGVYFGLTLLGALLLIAGAGSMSWRLRLALRPEPPRRSSPVNRLYPAAALGVVMLFSDLPTQILNLAWGLTMLVFLVCTYMRWRKARAEALPGLERFLHSCSFLFGLASLAAALFGYARLSILLFMALFALVNIITMGSALMGLASILVDKRLAPEKTPMLNAMGQALGVPLAWVIASLCAVPWLLAVPGARYLLQTALETDYTVAGASFGFSKLLGIVLLFFIFRSFIGLGRTSLEHLPDRVPNMERGVVQPLSGLLTYGLWALFALVALGMLGVNLTSLAVVAGGLSVGIGFGMQNIFNNLVSGLMLIFGRSVLVGDVVEVGGVTGTVKAISIRSTILETVERAQVFIPNSAIMSSQFKNWTRNSRMVRRSVVVGVAYGTDTEMVTGILLDLAKAQKHVLKTPPPAVAFTNFGDSALEFTLNVFVDDIDNGLTVMSGLRYAIDKAFAGRGIEIPFPQVTMHTPG